MSSIRKKLTRKAVKKFFKEAVIFGVLWELFLTPIYMALFGWTVNTLINETLIEATMVTPLAPIVYRISNWILRKWGCSK